MNYCSNAGRCSKYEFIEDDEIMSNTRTFVQSAFVALVMAGLVGCGGGSESPPEPNGKMSGRIADGYIRGALVFWDCNNNFRLDADEPSTVSKEGGRYEILRQPSTSCQLSADVPSSAIDEDTGEPVLRGMFMRSHPSSPTFISPLTTVVALNVLTEAQLKARFGVGNTLDVTDDYIAAGPSGVAHHNVARYVAVGLQSLSSSALDEGGGAIRDRLNGVLALIPVSAYSSNEILPATTFSSFSQEFAKETDDIKISSGYMRYEVDQQKYAALNSIQKTHVDYAFEIYKANADLIGQGETLNWSNLPLSVRQDLKARFVSAEFKDPPEVVSLIEKRNAFLGRQRSELNLAALRFDRELGAIWLEGAIDVSFTYLDGVADILPATAIKIASKGLKAPQKSSTVRKLQSAALKMQNLQSDVSCLGVALSTINSLVANLDKNQFVEPGSALDSLACLIRTVNSPRTKNLTKTAIVAIKGGGVISSDDRDVLEGTIAMSEFIVASFDLFGIDDLSFASEALGGVKVLLSGLKAFKLASDMGNTNDATQLAFEKAIFDIGKKVDEYLEHYAVEAFDLRVSNYFRYVPPYAVDVLGGVAEPMATSVNASLSLASYVSFSPRVQWFFGDGNTSIGHSASHIYSRPGRYTLTAYAQADTELAVKVYETTVDVACAADQVFSGAEGCINADPNSSIVVSWDLGSVGTPIQGRGTNPRTVAINAGVEIEGFLNGPMFDVDVSNDRMRLFNFRNYTGAPGSAVFDTSAFNGLVLRVPSGASWTFTSASVGSANTLSGLAASRLDAQAQRLAINLAGLGYDVTTVVEVAYARGSATPVSAGKLPHTGITANQCFAAGGSTLLACSQPGALALNSQQDGHRANINAMSYSQVGSFPITSCVRDNVTGLIWEGKEASGTRAGSNTYTNYQAGYWGTQAQMDAATNTYGYVDAVNAMALCGYTDWRLPTVDELQSIVDYGRTGLAINPTWFPNTPNNWHWASSPYVGSSSSAWGVSFYAGSVDSISRGLDVSHVRLVRASQ